MLEARICHFRFPAEQSCGISYGPLPHLIYPIPAILRTSMSSACIYSNEQLDSMINSPVSTVMGEADLLSGAHAHHGYRC